MGGSRAVGGRGGAEGGREGGRGDVGQVRGGIPWQKWWWWRWVGAGGG